MLAVLILGMMALVIYRFVQANVTAMRVSSEMEAVAARYDGLRELLTQQLQSLPPGAGALTGEPLKIEGHVAEVSRRKAGEPHPAIRRSRYGPVRC